MPLLAGTWGAEVVVDMDSNVVVEGSGDERGGGKRRGCRRHSPTAALSMLCKLCAFVKAVSIMAVLAYDRRNSCARLNVHDEFFYSLRDPIIPTGVRKLCPQTRNCVLTSGACRSR
jgi:hypothetical protein